MTLHDPVRLAVVGCGAVTERCHLPAIRRVSGVRLCALVEKAPEQLRRIGREFKGARLCRDVEELPSETDAAIVAVPNALHAPITVSLLRRGIHVLCEKPMATSLESCREMIQASRETGALLMIGHHKRFVPSVRKAKDLLDEGRLGPIRSVTCSMGLVRTWRTCSNFHLDRSLAGGGVLIDNGVHLIDLVLWLAGEISVTDRHLVPDAALELEAKLEFRVGSSAHGVLRVSDCRVLQNVFRIEGESGFLEFDTYDYPRLKIYSKRSSLSRNLGSLVLEWPKEDPYRSQLAHFADRLKNPASRMTNSGEDGMKAVAVVVGSYGLGQSCAA